MALKFIRLIRLLFIKCVYYSFKIFGIATVALEIKTDHNKLLKSLLFKSSKCGIVYNLFLIVLMMMLYYFAVEVGFFDDSASDMQLFDRILHNIHNLSAGLACFFIILYFCVSQKRATKIANSLWDIGESLIEIGNRNSFDDFHRRLLRETITIYVLNFITWLPIAATIDISTVEICLSFIYKQLCHVIIVFTFVQYSVILILVRLILEAIIENLKSVLKNAFSRDTTKPLNSFTQFKINHFWRLSEFYISLCDVSDNISQFYSAPMLFSLPYIFITLIFLSHYVLKPVIIVGVTAPISLVVHCIFRVIQFLLLLITLTKMAGATVSKSKAIGKEINEQLGLSANQCVDTKIYYFANYLLHRICQFSVHGLFSIDASLLMSIVGTIVTYLVICLQFQKSDSD